jgi:hypothetical protein
MSKKIAELKHTAAKFALIGTVILLIGTVIHLKATSLEVKKSR